MEVSEIRQGGLKHFASNTRHVEIKGNSLEVQVF